MDSSDPFDLARFRIAQEPIFETVLAELRAGRKRTHWMWFVFPQLRGLGSSPTAIRYAIASLAEARAYLADSLLGKRLALATQTVVAVADRTAHEIFGFPDDLKFHSSMTLFDQAAADPDCVFRQALLRFFDARPDERTLALLGAARA
jgi:uncharacterized protein (DUF1810 family)